MLPLHTDRMEPAEDGTVSPRPRSPLQLGCAPGLAHKEGQEGKASAGGAAEGKAALQRQPEPGLRAVPTAPGGEEGVPQRSPQGHRASLPIRNSLLSPPAPGPGYKLAQLI